MIISWTCNNIYSDSPSDKHTNLMALRATSGSESERKVLQTICIVKNPLDKRLGLNSRSGDENPSPTVKKLYSKNPY